MHRWRPGPDLTPGASDDHNPNDTQKHTCGAPVYLAPARISFMELIISKPMACKDRQGRVNDWNRQQVKLAKAIELQPGLDANIHFMPM